MTLDNLEGKWTSSAGDFLAKHFHSQADDWDLKILEGLSFLRLLERPNKSNQVSIFGKRQRPTQSRRGTDVRHYPLHDG